MFQKLTNLRYQRTRMQALAFYLIYTLALIVIQWSLGFAFNLVSGQPELLGLETVVSTTRLVMISISLLATAAVLRAKNLLTLKDGAVWFFLSLIISWIGGHTGAFIVAALLTTRAAKNRS